MIASSNQIIETVLHPGLSEVIQNGAILFTSKTNTRSDLSVLIISTNKIDPAKINSAYMLTKEVATLTMLIGLDPPTSLRIFGFLSILAPNAVWVELVKSENGKLVKRESMDIWNDTCLLFGHEMFATFRRIPYFHKFDAYFATSQSIILDYYKLERNNYIRSRIVKNRHQMVIKVLLEHLNRRCLRDISLTPADIRSTYRVRLIFLQPATREGWHC